MKIYPLPHLILILSMVFMFGISVHGQAPMPTAEALQDAYPVQKHYSPYAGRNFPTQVYWGDTHLHTGMSMDAGAFGARLTPDDAYRFAIGEELTSSTGLQVKLSRPLDFLVVAALDVLNSFFHLIDVCFNVLFAFILFFILLPIVFIISECPH